MKIIRRSMNPKIFQGVGKRNNYFEGWYHKHVSVTGFTFAVIGGLAYSNNSIGHSFVQVISGKDGSTSYIEYPIDQFNYHEKDYCINIGPNIFSNSRLKLEIQRPELSLGGELNYQNCVELQRSPLWPGIMGWYRFVPRMECYHGIVSLHHTIKGKLSFNGEDIDFSEGTGYIEKDWGSSMPSNWIWLQANTFSSKRTCLMLSVATIPWMGSSFVGFLGVLHTEDHQYRFATYTGAEISNIEVTASEVLIEIADNDYFLKIYAEQRDSGTLKAPVAGDMNRRINESIDSTVRMRLEKKDNKEVLFEETSNNAGLEMVGEISNLSSRLQS